MHVCYDNYVIYNNNNRTIILIIIINIIISVHPIGLLHHIVTGQLQTTAVISEQLVPSVLGCSSACYLHPTCRGVSLTDTGSSLTSRRHRYTCRCLESIRSVDYVVDDTSDIYQLSYL